MVFVIAEVGVNHNGSLLEAYKLIDAAHECGVDAVKFQAFTPDRLDPPGPRRDMLKSLALSRDDFCCLYEHCEQYGIEFMATPFDTEWLSFLVDLGMRRIKIASGSVSDTALVEAVRDTELLVYLSTGLATHRELCTAVRMVYPNTTLMYCVSKYPTPVSHLNLRRMQSLMTRFGLPVGLSDHSWSIYPPIAAVGMGAVAIEKHITLCRDAAGPDHKSSMEPADFIKMVSGIRAAESALGSALPSADVASDALAVKKERDEWRDTLSATVDTPAV